jgi:crossover junction endodeoxyribonuclease RusA
MNTITTIQLPREFVVLGRPISHQTKNKEVLRSWKEQVHAAVKSSLGSTGPSGDHIKLTITHFYLADLWESNVPDSDNIVKPIRDALNKLVYVDDYQISDSVSQRRDLNSTFRVRGMSVAMAEGFCYGDEFVHLLVEAAPDPTKL